MVLTLRYAVRSDLGLVRGNNEDSVYAGPRLIAIADGMGGHAAGEVASKIVISTLEGLDEDRTFGDLMTELRDAVDDANRRIEDAVARKPELEGMGTTLTALRFVGNRVGLIHVGDSRGYLLRGDALAQITHDDTYVQFLVDSGKLTAEEAKDHPRKSVILKALRGVDVDPDVSIREARHGDRYMLCTDGLSDVVSTDTILETMRGGEPQECADRLVELALRGGGPDNVTVVVADVLNRRAGAAVDEVPVVAGAFVDPAAADIPTSDSPAERAAQLGRSDPRPVPHSIEEPKGSGRGRVRRLLAWAVGVALVVGALVAGYAWTQSYYFVGRDAQQVAIFRGVNASFGPLRFYEVEEIQPIQMTELTPLARSKVEAGMTASSKAGAEHIVDTLADPKNDYLLRPCASLPTRSVIPPGTASPSASPTTPGGTKTATGTAAPGATQAPGAGAGSSPVGSSPVGSSPVGSSPVGSITGSASSRTSNPAHLSGTSKARVSTVPTTAKPSSPPVVTPPLPTPQPGVNCR